jgi:plastocyanin
MMEYVYEIEIKVSVQHNRTNFSYIPSTLHASPGDLVKWVSREGPFAIQFRDDTPGDRIEVHSCAAGEGFETDALPIRSNARGHYHYAVAVSLQHERFHELVGRVVLDGACPEIIVN